MLIFFAILLVAVIALQYYLYTKTTYYQITKNPWLSVYFDKGRLGEYLIYKRLRSAERSGAKFLFNAYIPKGDNETTEIDVLMIHPKGLFVFESKNYSGWIFGNEQNRNWYQTLPLGRRKSHKEVFYNPIMQNKTHIKHLKLLLGEDVLMHSIIAFSERCTLKKLELQSRDVQVINRFRVAETVRSICVRIHDPQLTAEQIQELYEKLYPYTQVDAATKAQHIENIENKTGNAPAPTPIPSKQERKIDTDERCPKCGGALILRTARRGANAGNQFMGCSNYPQCRYMLNLPQRGQDEVGVETNVV